MTYTFVTNLGITQKIKLCIWVAFMTLSIARSNCEQNSCRYEGVGWEDLVLGKVNWCRDNQKLLLNYTLSP